MLLTVCSKGQIVEFNHITNENGLSSNSVLAICQDALGYIWLGTPNGLNRYDGTNIKTYSVNNNKNFPPNIYTLYTDSNKFIHGRVPLKKYIKIYPNYSKSSLRDYSIPKCVLTEAYRAVPVKLLN